MIDYIKSSKGDRPICGAMVAPCGTVQQSGFLNVKLSGAVVCESNPNQVPVVLVDGSERLVVEPFVEGDSPALLMSGAVVSDNESSTLTSIRFVGEIFGQDGADERMKVSTVQFPSNATASNTLTVGSTLFKLSYDAPSKTLTVTKNAGGTFTITDGQALIRLFQYNNLATPPNTTQRYISLYVNDGTDDSLPSAVKVNVSAA
jgi:hypothetical protein